MIGDWDLALQLTKNLKDEMEDAAAKGMKIIGLQAEKIAKMHISRQDLNWKPLNEEYKERKKKQGYSTNILVRTSTYFQNITTYTTKTTTFAGVRRAVTDDDGNEIANLAAVHEFGSAKAGIDKRPLWTPTFVEVKEWIKKEKPFLRIFFKQVRSKYKLK